MTASNFDRSLSLVLASEGGFANDPRDPGGATNLGITLKTLEAFRGKPVTVDDVKALTVAEAGQIYDDRYWLPIEADRLPSGVDYAVFDFAVNSGPVTAVKFLQRCLSVTDDGKIGPLTLTAVGQVRPADLINSLCDKRLAYLRSLGTWADFGAGWSARIARVRKDALTFATLAGQSPAPNVAPAPQPVAGKQPPVLTPRQPDDPGIEKPAPSASPQPTTEGTTLMHPMTAISLTQISGWATMLVSAISGIAGIAGAFSPTTGLILTAIVGALNGFAHAITPSKT